MAARKKKEAEPAPSGPQVTQHNVSQLASQALLRMRSERVRLPLILIGEPDSAMLMQRWTTKAVVQMLMKQVTGVAAPRELKDLTKLAEDSWYRDIAKRPGIPCRIIKAAIVSGAVSTQKSVSKAELKRQLRIVGFMTPLLEPDKKGKGYHLMELKPNGQPVNAEMNLSIVRNANGMPEVRSRALFPRWACKVVLEFSPRMLAVDKVMAAVAAAASDIGIGEWRSENGGELGRFTVEPLPDSEVDDIIRETRHPEEPFIIPPELLRAIALQDEEDVKQSDPVKKVRAVARQQQDQQDQANGASEAE